MITDDKTWKKSAEILALMQDGMTVGQFLDALVLAQATILSVVPTHKAIREIADEIREKVIANTTFIKENNTPTNRQRYDKE